MDTIIPQKRCSTCKCQFPATSEYFHRDKTSKDGLCYHCKECNKKRVRTHYRAHPEHYRDYARGIRKPIPQIPEGHKRCSKCKQFLPMTSTYFSSNKRTPDHLERRCKGCCKIAHPRTTPLPEPAPPGYKRCISCKIPKLANLDNFRVDKSTTCGLRGKCKECDDKALRQYYLQNRQRYSQQHHARYMANKEPAYIDRRIRRARQNAVPGTHTLQQIREQYSRQKSKCYYCGNKIKWGKHHVDHTFPLSRENARNSIDHLVIACPSCNLRKGDRYPWEWFEGGRLL